MQYENLEGQCTLLFPNIFKTLLNMYRGYEIRLMIRTFLTENLIWNCTEYTISISPYGRLHLKGYWGRGVTQENLKCSSDEVRAGPVWDKEI